ncbi:hypothetical protein [Actinomadura madurae]|uniref:hypothetical protein n=1 Tax=Actinomadura madurae TaxID=1993 RepID=UPI0020D20B8C|nr:hypothetical protein [Actinomadura madurae]MCQ0008425.1 hypothetical protein [Actinomadura madurae]
MALAAGVGQFGQGPRPVRGLFGRAGGDAAAAGVLGAAAHCRIASREGSPWAWASRSRRDHTAGASNACSRNSLRRMKPADLSSIPAQR